MISGRILEETLKSKRSLVLLLGVLAFGLVLIWIFGTRRDQEDRRAVEDSSIELTERSREDGQHETVDTYSSQFVEISNTQYQRPGALIYGWIHNARRQAISSARITIYSEQGDFGELVGAIGHVGSNSEGYYSWPTNPLLTQVVIGVEKQGYTPAKAVLDLYPAGGRMDFVLESAVASVSGLVVDLNSEPIREAIVVGSFGFAGDVLQPQGGRKSAVAPVVTNEDGVFALGELPAGQVIVVAGAEGYVGHDNIRSITLQPGDNPSLTLSLERGIQVEIVVKDPRGDPISRPYAIIGGATIVSGDDAGRLTLTAPSSGLDRLEIGAKGFVKQSLHVAGSNPPSAVTLNPAPQFTGLVLSSAGQPLSGAVIRAISESGHPRGDTASGNSHLEGLLGQRIVAKAESDADGTFSMTVNSSISYLEASKPGFVTSRTDLGSEEDYVEIVLSESSAQVYGVVLAENREPVETFCVFLEERIPRSRRPFTSYDCFSNPDGRFYLGDLPSTDCWLTVLSYALNVRPKKVDLDLTDSGAVKKTIELDVR